MAAPDPRLCALFRVVATAASAAAIFVAFILPDAFWDVDGLTEFSPTYLALLAAMATLLSLSRRSSSACTILATLALISVLQASHFAYFGAWLTPFALAQFWPELDDVVGSALAVANLLWLAPAATLAGYAAAGLLLHFSRRRRVTVPYLPALLGSLLLFFAPVHSIWPANLSAFFPSPEAPSLVNGLNAVSAYFTRVTAAHAASPPAFAPPIVEEKALEPRVTVVYVVGESASADHMSVLGYGRPTTPRLEGLLSDPNFIAKPALAGGVATTSALPRIFNLQNDPRDVDVVVNNHPNLFALAKRHGFQTAYVSAQRANLLKTVGFQYIDGIVTSDSDPKPFAELHDEALLRYAEALPLAGRNFIVLHQRNAHGPYEKNIEGRPDFNKFEWRGADYATYMRNSYDDAILFNDFLYAKLIDILKRRVSGPLYVFFTSDHGQELGEQGFYGHSALRLGVLRVPFLFYGRDAEPTFVDSLRRLEWPSHFEVGVAIADRLGFRVADPNARPGVAYANGVGFGGDLGYLEILKRAGAAPVASTRGLEEGS